MSTTKQLLIFCLLFKMNINMEIHELVSSYVLNALYVHVYPPLYHTCHTIKPTEGLIKYK